MSEIRSCFFSACYVIFNIASEYTQFCKIQYFWAKNEQMILHFAEPDEITVELINNVENIDALPMQQLCFVYGNFGFYSKTILFQTARTTEQSNVFTDHIA